MVHLRPYRGAIIRSRTGNDIKSNAPSHRDAVNILFRREIDVTFINISPRRKRY